MAKHTPGPWGWTDGEKPIDIASYDAPGYYNNPQLHSSSGEFIVGCDEYWTIGPLFRDDEMRANARLISAAPDLLEAIEMVTSKLPVIMDPDADYSETCSEIEITWREWSVFRSAINKATGEA